MTAPAFRFAPSPTGYLHLGHALSALIGFELARRFGGRFVVRIEDTDTGRARQEYVDAILTDLAWLGIEWEQPVWRQSERLSVYKAAQNKLREQGLLYPCFATRSDIREAAREQQTGTDPDGAPVYPGLHKGLATHEVEERLARGEPYALRLNMDRALEVATKKLGGRNLQLTRFRVDGPVEAVDLNPARWGDVVIARKDTGTSYHIAGVIDDAVQGITHVCRGLDLEAASDIHRVLQVLLDLPKPLYHHHSLILDGEGRKLSKSAGDTALYHLRACGWTADQIRYRLKDKLDGYVS